MTEIAPRIVVDERIHSGRPVIRGTRMPVDLVVGHLAGGMSVEDVVAEYDLTRSDVLAALGYAARLVAEEQVYTVAPRRRRASVQPGGRARSAGRAAR